MAIYIYFSGWIFGPIRFNKFSNSELDIRKKNVYYINIPVVINSGHVKLTREFQFSRVLAFF